VAVRADLLEPGEPKRLYDQARDALGPITVLINNAAFTAAGRPPKPGAPPASKTAPKTAASTGLTATTGGTSATASPTAKANWPGFVSTPLGAYRRHFEIAVFAAYELMQLVVPDMIAAGYGSIVNISSGASRMPGDGPYPDRSGGILPGYGGSKAALEHLTQSAAYDVADRNISVNALSPSMAIMTPGLAYYSRQFDHLGSDADFAEATIRLALVDAKVVTGRTIGHLEVLDGSFRAYDHSKALH
jgi:NAD(P)-dependent dehydrogenase (short-subunit alcohol dehydrogenase family)